MHALAHVDGKINLQATLSVSSAGAPAEPVVPHHPITCTSTLELHEDGRLACEHAEVPADDQRTRHCLQHSVAILIIECAIKAYGQEGT